jgi:hypothetical protein
MSYAATGPRGRSTKKHKEAQRSTKKHKEDDVRKAGQVPKQIKLNKRRRIPINSVSDMAASIRQHRAARGGGYRMIAGDSVN